MGACASCTQAENTATCAEASQTAQRPADEGIELLRSRDRPGGNKPGVHSPNPRPGVLSATEFQNVGRTGSPDKCKQFFANVERDGKTVCLGKFETAEEAAFAFARSPEGQALATARAAKRNAVAKALMRFDSNQDGLDKAELKQAIGAFRASGLDAKKVEKIASEIFSKCDTDGNGRLSTEARRPNCPSVISSLLCRTAEPPLPFRLTSDHILGAGGGPTSQRHCQDYKEDRGGLDVQQGFVGKLEVAVGAVPRIAHCVNTPPALGRCCDLASPN